MHYFAGIKLLQPYNSMRARGGVILDLMARDEILRVDYMHQSEIILNDGVISLLNEMKSAGLKWLSQRVNVVPANY